MIVEFWGGPKDGFSMNLEDPPREVYFPDRLDSFLPYPYNEDEPRPVDMSVLLHVYRRYHEKYKYMGQR